MTVTATRREVLAFRLNAHHLDRRRPSAELPTVVGACAIQDSPPGSAPLAAGARADGLTAEAWHEAAADRRLSRTWCMRGSPYWFPTADLPVFTTGALPPTESALLRLIPGVEPSLRQLDLSLTATVDAIEAEIRTVLSGRRLAIGELGAELAERIAPNLSASRRRTWESEGPHAPGQPVGEAVVHFCLRILTLRRVVCFAPRVGDKTPFVLTDEWLDEPIPDPDPAAARAELLRRYLHCYGPSSRADFAAWLGVRAGDVDPWWRPLAEELTEVDFAGRKWLLATDVDALRTASPPTGVRLLPPRDPYIQQRDRATIVDKRHHKTVWKPVGDPGTVLADGEIVGVWRPRKSGAKLSVTVTAFESLPRRHRDALLTEAESVAPLRGVTTVDVVFDAP